MKKKNAANADAPLFTQQDYITARKQMKAKSHRARLMDYLWNNGSITSMEAFLKLNNTRISSTVHDLRTEYGVPISTEMLERKSVNPWNGARETVRYGVYSIRREER